jgi:putative ABC transport system permease protein
MRITYAFDLAFQGVRAKPSRTLLTLLGVAIGVAAVVAIAALGAGANALIVNEISGLGADVIDITPGRPVSGPADIAQTLFADTLVQSDLDAIARTQNAPHVRVIIPLVVVPGAVSYQGETYVPQTLGTNAELMGALFKVYPAEGELFGENEVREKAPVAVIGAKVKNELFGQAPALGQNITIRDVRFKVVGVLPPVGQVSFTDFDELVLIPYTTAQTYLLGYNHFNEVVIQVDDPANAQITSRDIEATLREQHDLGPGEENDFAIRTAAALMDQVGSILSALTVFLVSVVAIALVVGGIGIMNMMLVSVTERTREIGLRKAVGASNMDVLLQFLLEAVLLTLLGGAVGIALGAGFAYAASIAIRTLTNLAWSFVFPFGSALVALGFSIMIGLVFGLYPARKASRKSPMEALRQE